MTAEPSISTRQIRNIAIAIAIIAALLFLAKPLWQFSKEKMYGSETDTQITRGQAESALNRMQALGKRQSAYATKITEAQAAWRDAEIAFRQQKFKEAETGYRNVLLISDELAVKDNERKDVQQFFDEMNKVRETSRVAQAPQYATALWQDAENLRRAADTAFRTGDLVTAGARIGQAGRVLHGQGITEDNVKVLRAVVYSHHVRTADRWRVGRVFLAGDAAHAMPPWIGPGRTIATSMTRS